MNSSLLEERYCFTTSSLDVPDAVLAQQALTGDQLAFETMVQRYKRPLFNFIYSMVGDYDQAWDVLQHVLLCFFTSLPLLDKNRPLKPWLFRVARNRCVDEIRRRHCYALPFSQVGFYEEAHDGQEFLLEILDQDPLPEAMAERCEMQLVLQEAIASLPPKFRAVVWLRYVYQPSFSEIGKVLNIPTATVKARFYRAKLLLRQKLHAYIYSSDISLHPA
ncbi:RNA polymerase sigma factor [Ktedonobacter racemifer]|uniref:RNA polymerase, sigma-24 subunit, ECF subfamily n=1 Tax=Ktedonobacter racemifer DSM 44963 TaxID=485913 RepID=D6TBC6_KTERA|nr:sigma-70 family RNA polymerase sigma factor [Ktedonobacter racemifer]EFH87910.1 RNA polymerase, sigma-24 subunit, ECF subfamily [Ktedonobacter racemifer DSM 44963]